MSNWWIAILRRFDGSVNFDIVSKEKIRKVGNCIAYEVNKHIEEQGSQDGSFRNTKENFKRRGKNTRNGDLSFLVG
jgi:hypothetical protein